MLNKLLTSLTLILLPLISLSQNNVKTFLKLSDLACLDSLEYYFFTDVSVEDSVRKFKEINFVKKYAVENGNDFLVFSADYLKVSLKLAYDPENKAVLVQQLKEIQKRLVRVKSTPQVKLLNAYIESRIGGLLLVMHTNLGECIRYLLKSDLYFRKIGYENVLFATRKLSILGLYYLDEVTDYEKAGGYFKEAEKYIDQSPTTRYQYTFYKNYAKYFVATEQYDQAVKYYKISLKYIVAEKYKYRVGSIYGNIGEILLETSANPQEAEPYFLKELELRLKYKPKGYNDIAITYGNLCEVEAHKGNPVKAERYFKKAIEVAEQENDLVSKYEAQMTVYNNRMIADTILNDYKAAFAHQRLHFEAMQKLQKNELRISASESTIKFDAENNKLQAQIAQQEAKQSRSWILIVSLILLSVIIGSYLIYYRQRIKRKQLDLQLVFEKKEAERLVALDVLKNHFFTNISHELKTPLTLISGPIQELAARNPSDKLLKLVKRNTQRLQDLISQLLDIQKLEAGKYQFKFDYIDLPQYLRTHVLSFESMASVKNIALNLSQESGSFLAYVDIDKLSKIIDNLLSNAIKYSEKNSNIHVTATYENEPKCFELIVNDEGIGISDEDLPFVFDRFYQVNSDSYRGVGVGLALVKELVNNLQGTINVTSKIGVGTRFTVTLPVDESYWKLQFPVIESKVEQYETDPEIWNEELSLLNVKSQKDTEKELVLIVDDNIDMQEYLRLLLQENYEIITAANGKEGIEKANLEIPDLIISDLMMPLMDGFEFSRRIKNQLTSSHVPIVMLTAKDTKESKLEGLEIGVDHFLSKPFDTDELKIIVRKSIDNRKRLKTLFGKEMSVALTNVREDKFLAALNVKLEKTYAAPDLSIDDIAVAMNVSGNQLRRKLKAVGELSPSEYLRKFRLQKAANLLLDPSASVSEIAFAVGFNNLSYFSKVFNKEFGVLPSEYNSTVL